MPEIAPATGQAPVAPAPVAPVAVADPEPVPETPAPAAEPDNSPADLGNSIYFDSADSRLDARGVETLHRHARSLKENSRQVVTLVGYADPQGSRNYNLAIVEARLDAVAATLRSLGVPRGQIRRQSPGRAQAAQACASPACRQQMRRVDLVYGK